MSCLVSPAGWKRSLSECRRLRLRRIQLCVFQNPQVDQFAEAARIGFGQPLIVRAVEGFFVAYRAAGGQLEDVIRRVRADGHFQPAEKIRPAAVAPSHVVATDGRAPTAVAGHPLEAKTWKVIGKFLESLFNMLRQL